MFHCWSCDLQGFLSVYGAIPEEQWFHIFYIWLVKFQLSSLRLCSILSSLFIMVGCNVIVGSWSKKIMLTVTKKYSVELHAGVQIFLEVCGSIPKDLFSAFVSYVPSESSRHCCRIQKTQRKEYLMPHMLSCILDGNQTCPSRPWIQNCGFASSTIPQYYKL